MKNASSKIKEVTENLLKLKRTIAKYTKLFINNCETNVVSVIFLINHMTHLLNKI